jgi:zona occludens toxin (predicted ATPase)
MADDRFSNDPYRPLGEDEYLRAARRDAELQADAELGEGPASSGKIALLAVAVALVLGVVFYSLNNTSTHQASNPPPAQTAQTQPANPAAPPGMRDVTPRNNTQPGTTTGAAPSRPAAPAQPAPADKSSSQ